MWKYASFRSREVTQSPFWSACLMEFKVSILKWGHRTNWLRRERSITGRQPPDLFCTRNMRLKNPLLGWSSVTSSIAFFWSKDLTSLLKISILTGSWGIRVHHLGGDRNRWGRTLNWIRYPLRTTDSVQTSEVIFSQAFRKKEILPPVGRSDLGTCSGHDPQIVMPWQAWEPKWAPLRGTRLGSFTFFRTLVLANITKIFPRISLIMFPLTLGQISGSSRTRPDRNT